jgi:hypothetical protein
MRWRIRLTESARNELRALKRADATAWRDAVHTIGDLTGDRHPSDSIQLRDFENQFRG